MLQSTAEHKRTIVQILAFAGMSGLRSMKWFCRFLLALLVFVIGISVLAVVLDNPVIVFLLGAMLVAAVAVIGLPAAFIAGFASGMLCAVSQPRETHMTFTYRVLTWIGTGVLFIAAVLWLMPTYPRVQTVGFASPKRLDIPSFTLLRFANDSKSFFVKARGGINHYDLNGNILGQAEIKESIDDFCVATNGEELGVLVSQRFWSNDKLSDVHVDFIVVNVQNMTVSRRTRLLSGGAGNLGRQVMFSPTTNSWIVLCLIDSRNHLFALKADTLEKQAETSLELHGLSNVNICFVPGLEGTVGIDFFNMRHVSLLWNYLSDELVDKPTRVQYSGPFPHTLAIFDFDHERNCFLVFPFDSDVPSHSSAPLKFGNKVENDWGWRIAGISDDFKTALFFYHRPVMLQIPPPQRIFVVDVPSMHVIAERTWRRPHVREVFLSPDGKYVIVPVSQSQYRGSRIVASTFYIDIYEVSNTEPRPSEEWREVNRL